MNMKQTPSSARALCRFLIIFAALTHPRHCDALGVKTLISTIAHSNIALHQGNISGLNVLQYEASESELMEGIKLLERMKSASSCKTKATQQLLKSCSALDDTQSGQDRSPEELDRVKSQYAARLAVCELQEAEDPPKLPRCSFLGFNNPPESVNRSQLAACLRELQDNVIFWGSYINSLQNVGYMCQVARAEIEKEELVEQRRASMQTTLLVTRVLSEFQQSVAMQNAELLAHAQRFRELHRQNVEELVKARKETSATLDQLREDFGAQLQNMADKVEAVIDTITASASGTNEEVVRYVQNVQNSLGKIWQMMAEANAEIAARQVQDSKENHEMALATQRVLETEVMGEVGRISNALFGLSNNLQLAERQVTSLHQGHLSLADSLEESVAKSAHVADTLDRLNVPVLEVFARTASLVNFIFSEESLVLLGFLSPMAAVLLCAVFFPFRLMFWLLRFGVLLMSSYVILRTYTFWEYSPVLRSILHGAWQATTTSLALLAVCCLISVSFETIRGTYRRLHKGKDMVSAIDDEELSRFKLAREKSLEVARKSRFNRASTSPPC